MRMNTPPRNDDDIIEELVDDNFELIEEVDDISSMSDDDIGEIENWSEEDESQNEEELVDMANYVFSKHNGSVFTCAISPSRDLLASGGEDDLAYIWTSQGEELFTITGHRDSVTCLNFSHDGNFLASGDMSGFIQVHKIASFTKAWEYEISELNWLLWHSISNILFAGTREGDVYMWLLPKGEMKCLPSFGASTEVGSLTNDGKRIVVGYDDGVIHIFDLKSTQRIQSFNESSTGHSQPVVSLSCHKDNNLILSGSTDGLAKLLSSNNGKVIQTFSCDVLDDTDAETNVKPEVEVVTFCPTISNLAVSAALSGVISIWDISNGNSRHHIIQGCGTSKICWHPFLPIFYAGGLDGILRSYDVRSGSLLNKYTGHKEPILDISIKKDGMLLIASSDDGSVRIFKSLETEGT